MRATLVAGTGFLKGATFRLADGSVSVGRHASNQLCIGDVSVSRQHCTIDVTPKGYRIHDLGSDNGTFVNGIKVADCLLTHGDEIAIGDTAFHFLVETEESWPKVLIPDNPDDPVALSTVRVNPCKPQPLAAFRRKLWDVTTLATFSNMLNADLSLETLVNRLFGTLSTMMPVERGALLLVGHGVTDYPSTLRWNGPTSNPAPVIISRPIIDQVLRDGDAILCEDLTAIEKEPASNPARRPSVSVLALPLPVRGNVRGVIYLESGITRRFSDDDLRSVTILSGYIALAIESGRRADAQATNNCRASTAPRVEYQMIGDSPRMREVFQRIGRIAPTDATVLIQGETGTGKELAARAIHGNSSRAGKSFDAINCALLKEALLESELFGHEKGAFTGAVAQKKGKFEVADGGTIFLDEVADLPEPTQAMLLRVLQERTFERLGGTRTMQVDIRVIAASNKNLEQSVRDEIFRADLFYRLNVVSLTMPPLRDRRDDVPALAQYFLRRCSERNKRLVHSISPEAMRYLKAYEWPGNVRELDNAIEYAIVFGSTDEVLPEDLPDKIHDSAVTAGASDISYKSAIKEAKRQIVVNALCKAQNNYSEAAHLLNIHVNNLHRLIRELNLKASIQTAKERGARPLLKRV